jgi:hypothetical protein
MGRMLGSAPSCVNAWEVAKRGDDFAGIQFSANRQGRG